MNLQKNLNFLINGILIIFATYVLSQRIPEWYELYKLNNQSVASFDVYGENQSIKNLPLKGEKGIYIFWATWCGPCSIELARIQKDIQAKDFPSTNIHAISIGENPSLVFNESKKRGYSFNVYADTTGNHSKSFKVFATPTIYFVSSEGKIVKSLTGISPLLSQSIKDFLN